MNNFAYYTLCVFGYTLFWGGVGGALLFLWLALT